MIKAKLEPGQIEGRFIIENIIKASSSDRHEVIVEQRDGGQLAGYLTDVIPIPAGTGCGGILLLIERLTGGKYSLIPLDNIARIDLSTEAGYFSEIEDNREVGS